MTQRCRRSSSRSCRASAMLESQSKLTVTWWVMNRSNQPPSLMGKPIIKRSFRSETRIPPELRKVPAVLPLFRLVPSSGRPLIASTTSDWNRRTCSLACARLPMPVVASANLDSVSIAMSRHSNPCFEIAIRVVKIPICVFDFGYQVTYGAFEVGQADVGANASQQYTLSWPGAAPGPAMRLNSVPAPCNNGWRISAST